MSARVDTLYFAMSISASDLTLNNVDHIILSPHLYFDKIHINSEVLSGNQINEKLERNYYVFTPK